VQSTTLPPFRGAACVTCRGARVKGRRSQRLCHLSRVQPCPRSGGMRPRASRQRGRRRHTALLQAHMFTAPPGCAHRCLASTERRTVSKTSVTLLSRSQAPVASDRSPAQAACRRFHAHVATRTSNDVPFSAHDVRRAINAHHQMTALAAIDLRARGYDSRDAVAGLADSLAMV